MIPYFTLALDEQHSLTLALDEQHSLTLALDEQHSLTLALDEHCSPDSETLGCDLDGVWERLVTKGRGDIQPQLDSAMQDVSDKYLLLEETEKQAVRKALIEERSRLCTFVSMLRPVVVILDLKGSDYNWSYQTPPSSPSTTMSRKSSMCSSLNSINSSDSRSSGTSHSHSPSSSSSHYGCRSSTLPQQAPARLSSISSHDSGFISQPDAYTSKSPSPMPQETLPRVRLQNTTVQYTTLHYTTKCSGSSEASETCQSVSECSSPTSMGSGGPLAAADKLFNGYDHYGDHHHSDSPYLMGGGSGLGGSYLIGGGSGLGGSYPLFPPSSHSSSITSSSSCPSQSWSRPGSALLPKYPHYCTLGPNMVPSSKVPSWKDWAKPGPYDQPMVNTLRRRKDKEPAPADISSVPLPLPAGVIPAPENRSLPLLPPYKACEMEAHEELALALSRGLQLDSQTQRSSRDSLQCSTPRVPRRAVQRTPYLHKEFDKSSTIPRNSDISQSYRRMFQSKRPASTAGLPSTAGPVIMTPGVATIRRTPSTKPSARRGITGPIPIRTPVIPVKIPTVPGLVGGGLPGGLGLPGGPGVGAEEPEEAQSPESPAQGEEGELGVLPLASWSGQATTNPPLAPHQPGFQCQGEGGSLEDGEVMDGQGGNMLLAIQRGVKLKRTNTNDRSAPRIA
ncbi:unnamed protein product [Coregonus sp. 'balchen']|nr:unnamed protein product [Coregonus sp. 'balchen']